MSKMKDLIDMTPLEAHYVGYQKGRKEVVECVNELLRKMTFKTSYVYQNFVDPWKAKLEEWGIKND